MVWFLFARLKYPGVFGLLSPPRSFFFIPTFSINVWRSLGLVDSRVGYWSNISGFIVYLCRWKADR